MSIGIQKTFNLDMVPGGAPPVIHVSAGDVGRPFRAVLLYNGEVYTLEYVTSVKIRGTKPDNTVFEYALTFDDEDSHVDFVIEEQMAIIAGQVLCEIRLFSGDDTIGSANFVLDVEQNCFDPDASSESDIATISDYVAETVNEYLEEHPEAIVGVVDGSVTTGKIADGAVTAPKLAASAVTSAKIDDGAVTSAKIAAEAVTEEKVDPDFLELLVGNFVTPQEYGAKADGTTDDSTAIQSAINDGRAVFFPAGTYKISSTIIISDVQNKKIDASNAKFVYDGNAYAFKVTKAQNCDIHFGAIDSTNGGNINLVADSSSNFIQYCTFRFTYMKCVSGGINVNAEQTNGGWINEIKWFGGRFYGVNSKNFNLIHSTANNYLNGWAFYNIGFEGATTCLNFNSTVAVGSTGFITDFNFYGCRYIEGFTNFIVVEAGRVENLNFYDSVNPPWGKMTTTEYCTGWNYYPGNASVVKLRHNKWFREVTQKSLLGGGYVTNSDNFNNYLYAGNFVVSSNTIAGSLSNCPSGYAGKLTVENLTGYRLTDDDATSKYLNQTYADTNGDIWIRRLIVTNSALSTIGTWKKFTIS